jgi:hypothetical protein
MATTIRTLLRDFALANRLYANCSVYVYLVADGARSSTLATLYADTTSATVLDNPIELDNEGKNPEPVYFDTDVICVVDGLSVGTHETGIISPNVDATDIDTALGLSRQATYFARKSIADVNKARTARVLAEAAAAAAALSINQIRYEVQRAIKSLRTRFLQKANNLSDVASALTSFQNIGIGPLGQCYLSKSGANLLLARAGGGRFVFCNGKNRILPAAGLTLSAAGIQGAVVGVSRARTANVATLITAAHGLATGALAFVYINNEMQNSGSTAKDWVANATVTVTNATTFTYANTGADVGVTADITFSVVPIYFIYAADADSDGILDTLEASQTQPTDDATHGHKVKTGDSTRSLVGIAVSFAGAAWEDDSTKIGVLSYFNRKAKSARNGLSVSRTTNALYPNRIEVNKEIRVYHLSWGDDDTLCRNNVVASNNTVGVNVFNGIIKEDTTDLDAWVWFSAPVVNYAAANSSNSAFRPSLGCHATTMCCAVGANIGTWYGDVANNPRCTHHVTVNG